MSSECPYFGFLRSSQRSLLPCFLGSWRRRVQFFASFLSCLLVAGLASSGCLMKPGKICTGQQQLCQSALLMRPAAAVEMHEKLSLELNSQHEEQCMKLESGLQISCAASHASTCRGEATQEDTRAGLRCCARPDLDLLRRDKVLQQHRQSALARLEPAAEHVAAATPHWQNSAAQLLKSRGKPTAGQRSMEIYTTGCLYRFCGAGA